MGHDGLSQGGVGRRQHGRKNGELEQGHAGKYQKTEAEADQNGQRKTDQQQSLRDLQTDLENAQIRIGRIREQDQGQCQFG